MKPLHRLGRCVFILSLFASAFFGDSCTAQELTSRPSEVAASKLGTNRFAIVKRLTDVRVESKVIGSIREGTRLWLLKKHPSGFFWVRLPGVSPDQFGWVSEEDIMDAPRVPYVKENFLKYEYYASEHLKNYRQQWALGHHEIAEAEYQQYLKLQKEYRGDDHPSLCRLLSEHAERLLAVRRYANAKELAGEAYAIKSTWFGAQSEDALVEILILLAIAESEGDKESIEKWRALASDLNQNFSGENQLLLAEIQWASASRLLMEGDFQSAEIEFEKSISVSRDQLGESHPHTLSKEITSVQSLAAFRDLDKSANLLDDVLERSEHALGKNHASVAELFVSLAIVELQRSNIEAAEAMMVEARKRLESSPLRHENPAGFAKAMLRLLKKSAEFYGWLSRPDKARLMLAEAVSHSHDSYEGFHRERSELLTVLGSLAVDLGDFERALVFLAAAIEQHVIAFPKRQVSERIRLMKAFVLLKQGKSQQAAQEFESVISMGGTTDTKTLFYFGLALCEAGDLETAQKYWDQMMEMLNESTSDWIGAFFEGSALYQMGRSSQAFSALKRAMDLAEANEVNVPERAKIAHLLGLCLSQPEQSFGQIEWLTKSRRLSLAYCREMLPLLDDDTQIRFLEGVDRRRLLQSIGVAMRRPSGNSSDFVAEWLMNSKGVAHEINRVSTKRLAIDHPITQRLRKVRSQIARIVLASNDLHDVDRLKSLRELERKLLIDWQEVVHPKSDQSPQTRSAVDSWRSISDLRDMLSADSVYLDFSSYMPMSASVDSNEHLMVAIVHPSSHSSNLVDLGDIARVNECIANVRDALMATPARGLKAASSESKTALKQLSHVLLDPILPYVGDSKTWILCPDSHLWTVPWAALVKPAGSHVVEDHIIELTISGRELLKQREATSTRDAYVFAAPEFDRLLSDTSSTRSGSHSGPASSHHQPLRKRLPQKAAPLPGTEREARSIQEPLKSLVGGAVHVVLHDDANESAFLSVKQPRYLVASTHGFYLPKLQNRPNATLNLGDAEVIRRNSLPALSGLVGCGLILSGFNRRGEQIGNMDDGIVTGLDVSMMDLRGTELVVLSACNSGIGDVRSGEINASLSQAFHLAGAQSVLSSLWSIPDKATAEFMARFFEKLKNNNDPSASLRSTQLEMLTDSKSAVGRTAWSWGAFVITGHYQ